MFIIIQIYFRYMILILNKYIFAFQEIFYSIKKFIKPYPLYVRENSLNIRGFFKLNCREYQEFTVL